MSEMVVLDTHIWFWFINGSFERFPAQWVEQIWQADIVAVSAISCYEIDLRTPQFRHDYRRNP